MMQALLLLMMDPPPGGDAEFNAWANDEHIPERRNVPGFQTALRFQNTSASPRYLAIYDLDDLSVLQSPAYVAISGQNLSPWTKRILAGVTGRWRFEGSRIGIVCPPAYTGGRGPIGQLLLVLWRNVGQHCDEAVLKTIETAVADARGVIQVRGFRADRGEACDYVGIVESTDGVQTERSRYDIPGIQACDFSQAFVPLPLTAAGA